VNILVPNLGSTSLKYQILDMPAERVLAKGRLERVLDYRSAITQIETGGVSVDAVAFKTVHGGPKYRGTYIVDDGVMAALEEFLPVAPAHNTIYLDAIRAFAEALPGLPLVAAFETEFHATRPEHASVYGVPGNWQAQGIMRYGFHGASHEYIAGRTAELLGRPAGELRTVSCHLGGSSSMCAIDRGKSVDTTMGFSPQSGLENATRHGDLDVFAVLFLMKRYGWNIEEVRQQLTAGGGLAGISGVAGGDVRDIEEAARKGNTAAAVALEAFAYQVHKTIGAYAAAMGGLEAVAFTGGIGENSAPLRERCCVGLEFLGVRLDAARNGQGAGDRVVSRQGSAVTVLALETNEELIVARRAFRILGTQL
jgi:acetate kinase